MEDRSNKPAELRIGLGCMALTGVYGKVSRNDAVAVIHRAVELGIEHFDTAELYGPYVNEELLADALGSHLHDVRIATKFGYKIEGEKIIGLDSRPSNIRSAVEGSLRRLRRERIDLLYQHRVDPNVPIEDVVGTMADLVAEGKVVELGLSAVDAETIERAQATHSINAVQNEFSLIQRQAETEIMPTVEKHGFRLACYSPLGRGILCGDATFASKRGVDDYRISDDRFAEDRLTLINSQLTPLWDIAEQHGVSPAVIAIAWLLAKNSSILVIPGAKSPAQIEICMQAAVFKLSDQEYETLDAIND